MRVNSSKVDTNDASKIDDGDVSGCLREVIEELDHDLADGDIDLATSSNEAKCDVQLPNTKISETEQI